ncbi:methyltransferase [Candidatus Sumerlaeota bacterium]|nr:methyltransferase [Candidatus Sumerlaeota bacterium]
MRLGQLEIEVPEKWRGCRPGHEVVLLAESVEVTPGERVAELGSGVGALALALAARVAVEVVGFEIQPGLVEIARRNADLNAHLLRGCVRFETNDIRRLGGTKWEGKFDHVVANPPFYRAGQGRRSPQPARAMARHEIEATLEDFARAAAILLRQRGRFHCIFRPERLEDLLAVASRHRCPIKTIRPIYTREGAAAEWAIVAAVKGGRPGLVISPPQLVRQLVYSPKSKVQGLGASPEIGRRSSLRKLFLVVFDPEGIKRE